MTHSEVIDLVSSDEEGTNETSGDLRDDSKGQETKVPSQEETKSELSDTQISGEESECSVCFSEIAGKDVEECFQCGVNVHLSCYGAQSVSSGETWCHCVKNTEEVDPECDICKMKPAKIAMKKCGEIWVHIFCVHWVPEVTFEDMWHVDELRGYENLSTARNWTPCNICHSSGACLKCQLKQCTAIYHPLCARRNVQVTMRDGMISKSSFSYSQYTKVVRCTKHKPEPSEFHNASIHPGLATPPARGSYSARKSCPTRHSTAPGSLPASAFSSSSQPALSPSAPSSTSSPTSSPFASSRSTSSPSTSSHSASSPSSSSPSASSLSTSPTSTYSHPASPMLSTSSLSLHSPPTSTPNANRRRSSSQSSESSSRSTSQWKSNCPQTTQKTKFTNTKLSSRTTNDSSLSKSASKRKRHPRRPPIQNQGPQPKKVRKIPPRKQGKPPEGTNPLSALNSLGNDSAHVALAKKRKQNPEKTKRKTSTPKSRLRRKKTKSSGSANDAKRKTTGYFQSKLKKYGISDSYASELIEAVKNTHPDHASYSEKVRSILANLRQSPELLEQVKNGSYPAPLLAISSDMDLAPADLQKEREEERQKSLKERIIEPQKPSLYKKTNKGMVPLDMSQ